MTIPMQRVIQIEGHDDQGLDIDDNIRHNEHKQVDVSRKRKSDRRVRSEMKRRERHTTNYTRESKALRMPVTIGILTIYKKPFIYLLSLYF